jgi:hypothetical protein
MKRLLPVTLLLAASCATAPPAQAPQWTEIPPTILNAFCAHTRHEGIGRDTQIAVMKKTQPIITSASMSALASIFPGRGNASRLDAAMVASISQLPITMPAGSCDWRPIDRIDAARDHERVILQLSAPFLNPFAPKESGLFARMSVGGQAPEWFWIPVAEHNGQWYIGIILPLDLHEE